MKAMYSVIDRVSDEIKDAVEYQELARKFKATDPEYAKLCLDLAKDELRHANMLVEFKQRQCAKHKAEGKMDERKHNLWCDILPFLTEEIAKVRTEIEADEKNGLSPF